MFALERRASAACVHVAVSKVQGDDGIEVDVGAIAKATKSVKVEVVEQMAD